LVLFVRNGLPIQAKIIKIVTEPLDNSDKRQVVFFCQDNNGKRYRVPRSEIIAKVVTEKTLKEDKKNKTKKKRRKKRDTSNC